MKIRNLTVAVFLGTIIAAAPMNNMIFNPLNIAEAHQGRTDSNGGHHDYKNKSGLGSYHYHHGYPAHLHPNGVCPYENSTANTSNNTNTTPVPSSESNNTTQESAPAEVTGWQNDTIGWWYKDTNSTYLKNGLYSIDGYYYYFDSNGYMKTGWQTINGEQYYFDSNGHMVTGSNIIDGIYYYFQSDGTLEDDSFDDDWNDYDYDDDWDD